MKTQLLHDGEISVLSILSAKDSLTGTEIVDLSEGELNKGSVYVYLSALENMKCIQSEVGEGFTETADGRLIQRRYFSITDEGRRVLDENQSGPGGVPDRVPAFA